MTHRNDFVLYAVAAILLIGAASIWWQGVRPTALTPVAAAQAPSENDPAEGAGSVGDSVADSDGPAIVFVHVAGAVKSPGVYRLTEGQRLYEAISLAGPEDDADLDSLNLAIVLRDSQRIYVPRKGEKVPPDLAASIGWEPSSGGSGASGDGSLSGAGDQTQTVFPINVNTAGVEELDELPGVGPVLANAIITRRKQFGPFERPEDLKNVPGIGEKTYAKIAPFVTVK